MTEDERKLAEVQEKFGHLLPRETARAIATGAHGALRGRITRIFQPHLFERGGKKGRVCRVEIEARGGLNDGARKMLVLWDAEAEKLGAELREGDWVEATGIYEKEGEVHIGRRGTIAKMGAEQTKEAAAESARPRAIIKELKAQADSIHAILEVGGREVKEVAKGRRALELLGLRTPHEGISFYTILQLKKHALLGRSVAAPQEK